MNNTLVYVVLGVLVVVIGGWYMSGGLWWGGTPYVTDLNIDGSQTINTREGSVTVGVTSYPSSWPSDVPRYPNGQVIFAGSSNPQTGEEGMAVTVLTTDSVDTAAANYRRQLTANGWTVEQTASMGGATAFGATKGDRNVGVYITSADGKTSVTIGVQNN